MCFIKVEHGSGADDGDLKLLVPGFPHFGVSVLVGVVYNHIAGRTGSLLVLGSVKISMAILLGKY